MAKTKKDPNKKPPSNRKLEKAQDKLSKSTKNFDEVLVNQQQANQNSDGSALKKYKEKVKQGKKQLRFDKNKEKQRKKEEERRSGERGKIGENKEAHNLRLRQEAEKRRKGEDGWEEGGSKEGSSLKKVVRGEDYEAKKGRRAQAKTEKGTEKSKKRLEKIATKTTEKIDKKEKNLTEKITKKGDQFKSKQDEILKKGDDGSISKEEEREAIDKNKEKFKKKAGKVKSKSEDKLASLVNKKQALKSVEEKHPMNIPNPETGEMMTLSEVNQAVIDNGFQDEVDPLSALKGLYVKNTPNEALTKAIQNPNPNPPSNFDNFKGGVSNKINDFKNSPLGSAMQGNGSGGFQGTVADIANARNTSLDNSFAAETEENRGLLGLINRFSDTPAAAEKITNQDLFADLNSPIQVGTYSGRTTGSVPIFAAGGGYVPLGIIDSRKRALRAAATKKVERGEELAELVYAEGAVEYQDQINNMSNDLLEEYGEMVGYDWDRLNDGSALSIKFLKDVKDHQAFASETIRYDEVANQVITDMNDNTIYVPKSTIDGATEYVKGKMKLSDMKKDPTAWKNLGKWADKYQNLKDVYNKQAPNIEKQVNDIIADQLHNPKVSNTVKDNYMVALVGEDFKMIASAQAELIGDDRLRKITDRIHDMSNLYGSSQETYDFFRLNISSTQKSKSVLMKEWQDGGFSSKKEKDQVFTNQYRIMKSPEVIKSITDVSNNGSLSLPDKTAQIKNSLERSTGFQAVPRNISVYDGRLSENEVKFNVPLPSIEKRKSTEVARNLKVYVDREQKNMDMQDYILYLTDLVNSKDPSVTEEEKSLNNLLTMETNMPSVLTNVTTQYQNKDIDGKRHTLTFDELAADPNGALAEDMRPSSTNIYSSSIALPSYFDEGSQQTITPLPITLKTFITTDMTKSGVGLQDAQFSSSTQNITNESLLEQQREIGRFLQPVLEL